MQLTKEEISKSTGENYKVSLRYPKDIDPDFSFYSNPVIEKRVTVVNGSTESLASAEIITYRNQAGSFPEAYYKYKLSGTVSSIAVPLYTGNAIGAGFEKRQEYFYDINNNLTSKLASGIQKTGYKWFKSNKLLAAEIKNADETETYYQSFEEDGTAGKAHTGLKSSAGNYTVNWTRPNAKQYVISYYCLNGDMWTYKEENYSVNSLALSGGSSYDDIRIYPADAEMTSYTYGPFGLVSSMTDTRGNTKSFEYDSVQRLKFVKDQNGNIISSNDYNFKP